MEEKIGMPSYEGLRAWVSERRGDTQDMPLNRFSLPPHNICDSFV